MFWTQGRGVCDPGIRCFGEKWDEFGANFEGSGVRDVCLYKLMILFRFLTHEIGSADARNFSCVRVGW